MKVLISPHSDDEVLFCSWTVLRERPLVVIVYDSHVQFNRGLGITWQERRAETRFALDILGCSTVRYLGLSDADPSIDLKAVRHAIQHVLKDCAGNSKIYVPAVEPEGHIQHNLVGAAVKDGNITRYLTYTTRGKSENGREVKIESPDWIPLKLRALSCYKSQFSLDPRCGCWPHFVRSQREYYAE